MQKKKTKKIILLLVFLLLVVIVLGAANHILGSSGDATGRQLIRGFYHEPKNSVDAVYIGGSDVFMFFQPPLAWRNHGIAVWNFASNAQPFAAAEDLIREASKRQPEALYIISVASAYSSSTEAEWVHTLTDYLPLSANKLHLISTLADMTELKGAQQLEFYFPVLRFHTRWNELTEEDFRFVSNGLKGGIANKGNLRTVEDVTETWIMTEERQEADSFAVERMESLLDYCDKSGLQFLFVAPPMTKTPEIWAQLNSLCDRITARGYTVLHLEHETDIYALDTAADFYNTGHVNIHGSIKYTDYLCRYLEENYGFTDRRGQADYADWDEAAALYEQKIHRYVLPFEIDAAPRTLDLPAVEAERSGSGLFWMPVSGADGYGVFLRQEDGTWLLADELDAYEIYWNCPAEDSTVIVVAYRLENGVRCWGCFDTTVTSTKAK